ncbi:MAG: DinB family protein [Terriglobales bacterium]
MRTLLHWSSTFVLVLGLTMTAVTSAAAQGNPSPQATAAAPSSGVRAEFLNELKTQEDKFVQLAQAIPADKYTWRPAEGVRSVSEVFLHVATANYNLTKVIGFPPPTGFKVQGFDKSTTDKTKVISTLKDSFAHMRQAVLSMPDADVEKQVDWFGAKNTYRGILLFIIRHNAEHLGQAIAYARINGVVPPWTAEQQAQQKKQAEKPKQ